MRQQQGARVEGWRLDAYGTWAWQGASHREALPVEPDTASDAEPLRSPAVASSRWRSGRAPERGPTGPAPGAWEPTPIFQAVASEWERHRWVVEHRPGPEPRTAMGHPATVPAPRAATGPLPVQPSHGGPTRGLAAVQPVPPPPPYDASRSDVAGLDAGGAPAGTQGQLGWMPEPRPGTGPMLVQQPRTTSRRGLVPEGVVPPPPPRDPSLEDELIRRAQRRRRPLSPTPDTGGRHALRTADGHGSAVRGDRHRPEAAADVLTIHGIA